MKIHHVMLFLGAFQVCALHAQDKDPDASATAESLRILKEHRVVYGYGDLHLVRAENSQLPEDVVFPKDTLSLVADPKARSSGRIAVYIINATDKPAPGLDFEPTQVWQEVLDGDTWKRTRPIELGCGNVSPPKDLMAGHALIRTAEDPAVGDLEGDLRYCLDFHSGRPIVSQVIRGRYSSRDFQIAGRGQNRLETSLLRDLEDGISRGNWNQCQLAENHDEFATAVELLRFYDEARALRNALRQWLGSPQQSAGPSKREPEGFRDRLRKSLESPWRKSVSEREFFTHCLKLLAGPAETKAHGSSGKPRVMIWRCLNVFRERSVLETINPERHDQLESYRVTGNPWEAGVAEMSSIVTLAETDLASKDPPLQSQAGWFLSQRWVTKELFPDARLRKLLESGSSVAKRTALLMLNGWNQRDEAIGWLGDHYDQLEAADLTWVWHVLWERDKPLAPWETPIAKRLLDQQPWVAFSLLYDRVGSGARPAISKLPVELRTPVRKYLQQEAKERKVRGERMPQSNGDGRLTKIDKERGNPGQLEAGLALLASWEMPEDTELIQAFLTHPVAGYSRKDEVTETKFYTVREKAALLLKNRGVATPPGVILKEEIPARDLPPSRSR